MRTKNRLFRLPPCPPYDPEAAESWLEDMAAQGWMLERDSFFLGFAGFEKQDPTSVRYRLEASPRHASDWDDNGGAPDPEAAELNADFGWEYVARRGQFYIYRSPTGSGPELHTDPRVQALAVKALEKRCIGSLCTSAFWLGIQPTLLIRKGSSLLLGALSVGLPLCLLSLLLLLWLFLWSAAGCIHLGKLKRRLAAGLAPDHGKDWRRGRAVYFWRRIVTLVLILVWGGGYLNLWAGELTDRGRLPLAEYPGHPPFATMADFAEGRYVPDSGGFLGFDFRQWKNAFLNDGVSWNEHARIVRPDGSMLDGGLYVDYYEAKTEALAKVIAAELLRVGRRRAGKNYELLPCPSFGLDGAAAYRNEVHFPCAVLRQGRKVLRAVFYQTGPAEDDMTLEEWAGILADSIR